MMLLSSIATSYIMSASGLMNKARKPLLCATKVKDKVDLWSINFNTSWTGTVFLAANLNSVIPVRRTKARTHAPTLAFYITNNLNKHHLREKKETKRARLPGCARKWSDLFALFACFAF